MTYRAVLSALNEKKAIIQRTDDDHWLYEPISEAVDLIEELQVYRKAYEMVCKSLSDKTSCNWGYDDACKACQEDIDSLKTTSCFEHIKQYFLQKAREKVC